MKIRVQLMIERRYLAFLEAMQRKNKDKNLSETINYMIRHIMMLEETAEPVKEEKTTKKPSIDDLEKKYNIKGV